MITSAFIVPHPAILIHEIGQGEEKKAAKTLASYHQVANFVKDQKPDTIVLISSHAPSYLDYLHVSPGDCAYGDFEKFKHPEISCMATYNQSFVKTLCSYFKRNRLAAGTRGETKNELDYGTLVPLYFINEVYQDYELVRLSISGLSAQDHDKIGQCIRATAEELDENIIVIASGDLSHCLSEESPYGYHKAGQQFDEACVKAMQENDIDYFSSITQKSVKDAKQCGLPTFQILAGAIRDCNFISKVLSYEHPFGIGYAICAYLPRESDPLIALARVALEEYLEHRKIITPPSPLSAEMQARAGVFVSLYENNTLRGCIGSLTPLHENIASEIIHNAIHAATKDPRFSPLTLSQLTKVNIEIAILSLLEPVFFLEDLDYKRYGIIVTSGERQGVLLPNLAGITSVEQQLSIALEKAGIDPNDFYTMERFTITLHS